jgi:hypothetical protein
MKTIPVSLNVMITINHPTKYNAKDLTFILYGIKVENLYFATFRKKSGNIP